MSISKLLFFINTLIVNWQRIRLGPESQMTKNTLISIPFMLLVIILCLCNLKILEYYKRFHIYQTVAPVCSCKPYNSPKGWQSNTDSIKTSPKLRLVSSTACALLIRKKILIWKKNKQCHRAKLINWNLETN